MRYTNTHTQATKVIIQGIDILCVSDPFGSSFVIVTVDESICSRIFFFFFFLIIATPQVSFVSNCSDQHCILLTQCTEKDQLVNEAAASRQPLSACARGAISLYKSGIYLMKRKKKGGWCSDEEESIHICSKVFLVKREYILFLALKRFYNTHHHASCFLISIPS